MVIDCDTHPVLRDSARLLPYLDEYWGEQLKQARLPSHVPNFHPIGSEVAQIPEATTDEDGVAATSAENFVRDVFADNTTDFAVLNCLYSVQQMHQPRREQAHARALNTWIAREWLDADERLRASIVVPMGTASAAAEEIEYWAQDHRFVQVLLLGQSELLLGRAAYWPIWEAAEKHGLPVAIHIGGVFRQPPTSVGWPTSHLEWYVGQTANFEAQLSSIVAEGIFQKFPETQVLVSEAGFRWVPPYLWKLDKLWKTYRSDIPWVQERPSDLIRRHVKFTTSPTDGAEQPGALDTVVNRLGSDEMLVHSSDYPHRHHTDGASIFAGTADPSLIEKVQSSNATALYSRRTEMTSEGVKV